MKKLMLLLMLMVAMPSTAQKTDNPFPKKGYKVKWVRRTPHGFESYTCTTHPTCSPIVSASV